MNIRDWESRRTHQAWGTGSGSPAFMILTCLAVNFVSLIIVIAFNVAVIDDGNNDYGYGLGWGIMTPAPALGIIWTLIDVAVCHYSVLNPIYYLVESTFLMAFNGVMGSMSITFYSWDNDGSWVPGLFMLIAFLVYIAIMAISARLVHKQRKRPQSQGTA